MALMTSMRNRMHFVLWSLLALFILSMTIGGLVGGANILDQIFGRVNPSQAIGMVNGEIISPEDFSNAVSMQVSQFRFDGQEVTEQQVDRIRTDVWNSIVDNILVEQAINEMGIAVTDEDIIFHMENNPPSEIRSLFQTDGQFDLQKYQQALNDPQAMDWNAVESYLRISYIPRYKLQQFLNATLLVEDYEIRERFVKTNVPFTVQGVHVTNKIKSDSVPEPTEADILAKYEEDIENFKRDETRNLRYVLWQKVPTIIDSQHVFRELEDLKRQALAGADFAELANTYSEDPGNRVTPDSGRGGSLEWFSREQMVKPFSDAAFGAKTGEIVGPIVSNFGMHLIKVHKKQTRDGQQEVNASHILMKVEIGPTSRDELRRKATLFSYDAQDYGFDAALDTHYVTAGMATDVRKESQFIRGVGPMRAAAQWAFDIKIGEISGAFENDHQFVVVQLDSIISAGYTPLPEVRDRIKSTLTKDIRNNMAETLAYEIRGRVDAGTSFKSVMDEYGVDPGVEEVPKQTKNLSGIFTSIGKSHFVDGALMNAEPGSILGPLPTLRGYTVIQFLGSGAVDSTQYAIQKDALYTNILREKQTGVFRNWLQTVKDQAEIVDNRNYYF